MTKQVINIGTAPNAKNGDALRTAFEKVNANFTELYNAAGADVQIPAQANNAGKVLRTDGVNLSWVEIIGGTANTDIYKFQYGVMGTKDIPDTGGWGGYDMLLNPGGESNAFISIPSVANQADGGGLQIFNRGAANSIVQVFGQANVQMVTGAGASEKVFRFENTGTITIPSPTSIPFPAVFSATNYVSTLAKPTLTLTDTPWALNGQYVYAPDGRAILALDNIWPALVNPGYTSGDAFEFDETVHGITGYILTITLNDVVLAGPAGWTANVAESAAPVYAPTIKSQGAVKLTANTNSLILGTDGGLKFPDNGAAATTEIYTLNGGSQYIFESYYVGGRGTGTLLELDADNGQVRIQASGISTSQWTFGANGSLSYPNTAVQRDTGNVTCAGNASTVVYTASGQYQHTIRLLIQVEGTVGAAVDMDTQACEMIIAKSFRANALAASVYGVVHTSVAPLATFTANWNALTSRVEVRCTTPSANLANVKIFATEITTSD